MLTAAGTISCLIGSWIGSVLAALGDRYDRVGSATEVAGLLVFLVAAVCALVGWRRIRSRE